MMAGGIAGLLVIGRRRLSPWLGMRLCGFGRLSGFGGGYAFGRRRRFSGVFDARIMMRLVSAGLDAGLGRHGAHCAVPVPDGFNDNHSLLRPVVSSVMVV